MVQMHLIQMHQVVTMLADELESTELISRHELEKCYMITANNY